jgi:hypothetical protein
VRDAESLRLLQAVWDAASAVVGYLGWLWWGGLAAMLGVVLGVLNLALLVKAERRQTRWEKADR